MKVFMCYLDLLKGRLRVFNGFCPICNSDAPELDDCPMCESYCSARGDKFPPSKELKLKWINEYKKVIKTKIMIIKTVRKARKERLNHEH